MLTVTQFAKALALRHRRAKPYSRTYIHLLIQQRRLNPAPQQIGDQGLYLIDPKAVIEKINRR